MLRVGAGVSLPALVKKLTPLGWAGLEWAAGVPGTVGGAIVSNAGAHKNCVADTIFSARTLLAPGAPGGAPDQVCMRDFQSRIWRWAIVRAAFAPGAGDLRRRRAPACAATRLDRASGNYRRSDVSSQARRPASIRGRAKWNLDHRKETQPPQKSAGSVFKNPEPQKSGKLIQDAGLRPYRIGGAEISEKHANFIINAGGATAADVAALIALARRTVRERFGVELELEVEPRGDW